MGSARAVLRLGRLVPAARRPAATAARPGRDRAAGPGQRPPRQRRRPRRRRRAGQPPGPGERPARHPRRARAATRATTGWWCPRSARRRRPSSRRDAARVHRPESRPARHSAEDPPTGRQNRWAEPGLPTSAPPAVQVPPVGTAARGFEVPPGFHAPTADRAAADEAPVGRRPAARLRATTTHRAVGPRPAPTARRPPSARPPNARLIPRPPAGRPPATAGPTARPLATGSAGVDRALGADRAFRRGTGTPIRSPPARTAHRAEFGQDRAAGGPGRAARRTAPATLASR